MTDGEDKLLKGRGQRQDVVDIDPTVQKVSE